MIANKLMHAWKNYAGNCVVDAVAMQIDVGAALPWCYSSYAHKFKPVDHKVLYCPVSQLFM